ncbi:MAG: hypothetical protein ND895_03365 [Pyrinomonadaceae bacterium]|nr:hypothetical protein [Pyrinomonadaceae bacterium]
MIRKSFSILVLTTAAVVLSNAQQPPQQISDCGVRPKIEGNNPACFKPVVYGNDNDGFPKKMKIRGVVTKVTMTHIACGVLCLWGTAEIRLLKKPKGYHYEYLYVSVLCFGGNEKDYLSKIVEQNVRKSSERRYEKVYCTIIYNFLDSQGKPFYDLYQQGHSPEYKLRVVGTYSEPKVEG